MAVLLAATAIESVCEVGGGEWLCCDEVAVRRDCMAWWCGDSSFADGKDS
ncbi:nacht and ankyrin domain protein [Sesbania bispinosa]|nr:nacht and ankyrin domain protein [Sesbania bispinosa]